ncbi:MAG: [FeFe] hydrogenase H-cluster radical SAM maturase HydE [Spirochaetales bacterium]|nr:[FeFe] hydrogenase H-cluster radical SAM maturase HydE [Spirochaetales bacterium]
MNKLIKFAAETHDLSLPQIRQILEQDESDGYLFATADMVRRIYKGDKVRLIALLEFSNVCHNHCHYCGLRSDNGCLVRYSLSAEEIMLHAEMAKAMGFKTIALQSGESSVYSPAELLAIVDMLKAKQFEVVLSCGELDDRYIETLKNAGLDGYLLKIETTDQELYKNLHPGQKWENRNHQICLMKQRGYYVATGNIIGLPGQTISSIAEDILYFKTVGANFIGIGPLMPQKDTPLHNCPKGDINLVLKTMALCRILMPEADIVTTTALEALDPDGQKLGLAVGANVIMPNITNDCVRQNYKLFDNKENTNIAVNGLAQITQNIIQCNRRVAF